MRLHLPGVVPSGQLKHLSLGSHSFVCVIQENHLVRAFGHINPDVQRGNLVRDPWTAGFRRATSSSFALHPAGRGNILDSRKAIAPSWSGPLTPDGCAYSPPTNLQRQDRHRCTTQYTRVSVRQATLNQQTLTRNPAKGEQGSESPWSGPARPSFVGSNPTVAS